MKKMDACSSNDPSDSVAGYINKIPDIGTFPAIAGNTYPTGSIQAVHHPSTGLVVHERALPE